jgi:hypothetical protein
VADAVPHLGSLGFGLSTGVGVRTQIVVGQFVGAIEVIFEVRGKFAHRQSGPFLNADTVCTEQRQIRSDRKVLGGLTFHDYVKPVRARVFLLVESQVPDFQWCFLSERIAPALC